MRERRRAARRFGLNGGGAYHGQRKDQEVRLAIASGKGGTGKTSVAVNLAASIDGPVRLLDCDVEEPNCHIFLRPEVDRKEQVQVPVPRVGLERCNACGECGQVCQFHAIVSLKTKPLVFPDLCHGCGGCARFCPTGAIEEIPHEVGVVEIGRRGAVELVQGTLRVGHPTAVPVVRAVKRHARDDATNIVDCPPGTSCPMIAAIRDSDYVILVTEPTPFGLHDLTLAVDTVRQIGLPFGVLLNRAGANDGLVLRYCQHEDVRVLMRIADDRRIAEAYSRGVMAVAAIPGLRDGFRRLYSTIARGLAAGQRSAARGAWNANI